MAFEQLGRKVVLGIASNKAVTNVVTKHGMRMGAKRFIAGESLEQAVEMVKQLNKEGLLVTLDHVGESVSTKDEAIQATDEAIRIFEMIEQHQLQSNVSVKLTQLGLSIDHDFCYQNMDRIVAAAKERNNFVRIDIEDSPVVDITIDIFKRVLAKYGKEHVGLVVQSYLYRTEKDVEGLGKLGASLRIVKGAYKEPKEVAFPLKRDVDANYNKIVALHLKNGHYTAVATHDEKIIQETKRFVKENNISNDQFEFQMLYGVRNGLQRELVKEGYKVRVYTPYGKHWYPYFSRRIAERPANGLFILKSLFKS
ncbi:MULTISPECIES: proline dehydrogenase family protein [Tepidibacillus]|uniref:proline dehydrogenase n=1 Tax=Tepidibacillus decaturensis TaxID=1413211 RepID=A0A135L192_9BACI|nr:MULTISPECIES: proline dehydrogenase family protein [Tepidibacillus]KXG42637.1 proline dehydrogenase [Tepidibacillus decaturensis]GBF10777.1 proline dehydrogenase 1 [Tepidibacillus sp. HK-1]